MTHFFAKKLKKYYFTAHLYIIYKGRTTILRSARYGKARRQAQIARAFGPRYPTSVPDRIIRSSCDQYRSRRPRVMDVPTPDGGTRLLMDAYSCPRDSRGSYQHRRRPKPDARVRVDAVDYSVAPARGATACATR